MEVAGFKVRVPPPVLLIVKVWEAEELPITTDAKSFEAGLTINVGVAGISLINTSSRYKYQPSAGESFLVNDKYTVPE
ncbi:MAG: hypothetical protein M9926_07905 [Lentimicrobium sp.]|nr:hypothetical protein [Lentimicrobium sp.]